MSDEQEVPATQLLALLDPSTVDLTNASMKKFLAVADKHKLIVKVQATLVNVADEFYAADSKATGAKKGDIKKLGRNVETVSITMTDLVDFAAQAYWFDGKFTHCFIGGPSTGYHPARMFAQTPALEEIERCLS